MKIITVTINKGGTGKSTISFNLADYLTVVRHKKVLLLDGDTSTNLSFSFKNLNETSMYDLFTGSTVKINQINDNLDFIKGSELLNDDDLDLKSKQNNCLQLFMWFANHPEIEQTYDYVIIDTHNDKSLVTSNFIAVADTVLGVAEPSRNGLRAWFELTDTVKYLKDNVVEPLTKKSYIECQEYIIANKVEFFGNNLPHSSKEFLGVVEDDKRYLGMIAKKELLASSLLNNQGIFSARAENPKLGLKHVDFYKNIETVFDRVINL